MVWFRVRSRGAGVLVHGGTGQHPQHCQHHPQDADDAGEWGDHTIGGGGGVRGPRTGTYMLNPP